MNMREHHIGIVVKNIVESQRIFEQLGYKASSKTIVDTYQHNKILFLGNEKTLQKIELIEALDEQSTVKNFKPGLHHICYEADEGENFREVFREMGIGKIFSHDLTAPALDNRCVMFACLKNGVFVEFITGGEEDAGYVCTNSGDN